MNTEKGWKTAKTRRTPRIQVELTRVSHGFTAFDSPHNYVAIELLRTRESVAESFTLYMTDKEADDLADTLKSQANESRKMRAESKGIV